MDESGDVSFAKTSKTKYFIITCLCIPESNKHKLKNLVKKKKRKLYNSGWPKSEEIKASTLHQLNCNIKQRQRLGVSIDGDDYIEEIITSIINSFAPRIDYFALNKTNIIDESFKRSPYGIAYNFFSSKLLCPVVLDLKECKIFPDPRNKETRPKLKFAEYVKREIIWGAQENKIRASFTFHNLPSHTHPGLFSVDFFSWSINRFFAERDDRFFNRFKHLIVKGIRWYC